MNNTTVYPITEGGIYFIDGMLSFLKAARTKLLFAALLYILAIAFEYILRKPPKFADDCGMLTEQYQEIKKIYEKFDKVIPSLLAEKNPFFPELFKKHFDRYDAFLENLVDGLAISSDPEARESVRKLPGILKDVSEKLPTLDDVLNTL